MINGVVFDQKYVFQTNGSVYCLILTIVDNATKNKDVFDSNMIDKVEIVNEINTLYLTGSIIYNDTTGIIGKYFLKPFVHIGIYFAEGHVENVGVEVFSPIETTEFSHSFLIENIKILERYQNGIRYQINFIGRQWYKVCEHIDFSNYAFDKSDKHKQIFYIFNELLTNLFSDDDSKKTGGKNNITVDDKFKDYESTIKMDFATGDNDNIYSIMDYLFNKQFEMRFLNGEIQTNSPESLKYLVFDPYTSKYSMIDQKDPETYLNTLSPFAFLSLNGSSLEGLFAKYPAQLHSNISSSIKDFIKTHISRYKTYLDKNTGMFTTDKFADLYGINKFQQIIKNDAKYPPEYVPKITDEDLKTYNELFNDDEKNIEANDLICRYYTRESTSNAKNTIYANVVKNLIYKDALVVNGHGNIRHQPGTAFAIFDDAGAASFDVETSTTTNDYSKNSEILGYFHIVKSKQIIQPNITGHRFTEMLVLNRSKIPNGNNSTITSKK